MKKKIVLGVVGLLVLVLVIGGAVVGSAFMGNKAVEDGKVLGGGAVTTVLDGFVSAYLVDAGEGRFALIDAGMNPEPVLAALKAKGADASAVKWVLLTHGHGDHVGGLSAFPAAEVRALPAEQGVLDESGVKITAPLADGEKVQLGAVEVEVFALPGHTPGSAAYLTRGVLFFGDSAGATDDDHFEGSVWIFSEDTDENRRSLEALAKKLQPRAAEVEAMAFGHTGALEGPGALFAFAGLGS